MAVQAARGALARSGLEPEEIKLVLHASVYFQRALHESRTELKDITRFVVPHVGRILLEREYFAALRIPESATTWPWGRRIGHLGAGDQIAGFGHLVETNALQPGQRCLLMGVGAGFTWTCAVIELLERPSHPSTTFSLSEGETHAHRIMTSTTGWPIPGGSRMEP